MAKKFEKGKHYVFSCKKYRDTKYNDGKDDVMANSLKGLEVFPVNEYSASRQDCKGFHWRLIPPEMCTEIKQNYKKNW